MTDRKLVWLIAALVLSCVVGGMVRGQEPQLAKEAKGTTSVATVAPKPEEKKLPTEVPIPDARLDKVKVLVLERALVIKEGEELERRAKDLTLQLAERNEKIKAEVISALKLAGVPEDKVGEYAIDLQTLKIARQEPKAQAPKP